MRSKSRVDVVILLIFLLIVLVSAAVVTPYLYNLGMFLVELTSAKYVSDQINWLGRQAAQTSFAEYYPIALVISSFFWLIPLSVCLNLQKSDLHNDFEPWSTPIPAAFVRGALGQALINPKRGWLQGVSGFFYGLSAVGGVALIGHYAGLRLLEYEFASNYKSFFFSCVGVFCFVVMNEFFFRGVLMGVFLRAFRSFWAIIIISFIYMGIMLMCGGGEWKPTSDPETISAGFELLWHMLVRLLVPTSEVFWAGAGLFSLAFLLGIARYVTACLWLPIGIHSGWLIGMKALSLFFAKQEEVVGANYAYFMEGQVLDRGVSLAVLLFLALFILAGVRVWKSQAFWSPEKGRI